MKRFADPRYWLTLAAVVLGTQLGLEAGAERYIQRQGLRNRAELTELERWKGNIHNVGPWAIAFSVIGVTAVFRFAPEQKANNSKALKALAEQKLSQPLLTEDETHLWVTVLEATEDKANG